MGLLLDLTKARITFFVTLSVATGFLLFKEHFDLEMLLVMGGVFLLACGSAALNQGDHQWVSREGRACTHPTTIMGHVVAPLATLRTDTYVFPEPVNPGGT